MEEVKVKIPRKAGTMNCYAISVKDCITAKLITVCKPIDPPEGFIVGYDLSVDRLRENRFAQSCRKAKLDTFYNFTRKGGFTNPEAIWVETRQEAIAAAKRYIAEAQGFVEAVAKASD